MAADREVMKEFLVSLGVTIDGAGVKKFDNAVAGMSKLAAGAGMYITGIATASELMVKRVASSMETLYYASQRTKASVQNIQALQYGFSQIGLDGDKARVTIENFSRAIRTNPGMTALLNSLGVKTEGRDRIAVMSDFVDKISSMPHAVGSQFAEMFGMDEETFLMWKTNKDALLAAEQERIRLNQQAGISAQEAAAASKDYMNGLRALEAQVGVLGNAMAIEFLPVFQEVNGALREFMSDVADNSQPGVTRSVFWFLGQQVKILSDYIYSAWEGFKKFGVLGGMLLSWKDLYHAGKKEYGLYTGGSGDEEGDQAVDNMLHSKGPGSRNSVPGNVTKPATSSARDLFNRLEKSYGLPEGLLDRMWRKESGRGESMISPKGALGHFQFMPKTAKEYGVGNPFDLTQSATGAARYMSNLLKKYGGDTQMALAAYNWGEGNLDKYGLGRAPSETRDYVRNLDGAPSNVRVQTTINVGDTGDPAANAKAVARVQDRLYADATRNLPGSLR